MNAIRGTGLEILQIDVGAGPVEIIQRLMETAGMAYTASPIFYGANRPAEFNTAISINGILIPTDTGENRLIAVKQIPELIKTFFRVQGIQLVRVKETDRQ